MTRPRARWLAPVVLVGAGVLGAGACSAFQDAPDQQPCGDIPEGGCPGAGTGNCLDPTCAAIYTCEGDGGWTFSASCPVIDGGRDSGVKVTHPDANLRRDVDFDVPPGASGGPGCIDLEAPDCPLSLALACPSDQCCCCAEVFVCSDGGWNLWGQCEEGGALVTTPPLEAPDE